MTSSETVREFFSLMNTVKQERLSPPIPQGLTRSETLVMITVDVLSENGGKVRPSKIAESVHCSASALSQTLRSLEMKGYITRARTEDDFRSVEVFLTEEGRALTLEGRTMHEQHLTNVLNSIGEQDAQHLIRILRKVAKFHQNLDEHSCLSQVSGSRYDEVSSKHSENNPQHFCQSESELPCV